MTDGTGEKAFILSFLSPETGCAAHQMRFLASTQEVASFLDYAGRVDDCCFSLDAEDLAALALRFELVLPPDEPTAELSSERPFDSGAPYLIHTNFELPLMIDGRKPFAAFYDIRFDEEAAFGALRGFFRPHVEAGRIVETFSCGQLQWPTANGGVKAARETELFYTLPGEEWRIAAWKALIGERAGRWRDEDTREEGRLLGYTRDQCDWYIEAVRQRRQRLQEGDISA